MTIEKAILVDEAQAAALAGGAIWLMQKRRWNFRGPVGIVVRGSASVTGVAEMADCLEEVDAAGLAAAPHGLDAAAQAAALQGGATVPWVLSGVRMLDTPVDIEPSRTPGPTMNLDAATGKSLLAATNGATKPAAPAAPVAKQAAGASPPKPRPAPAPAPAPEPKAKAAPPAEPKAAAAPEPKPAAKPTPTPQAEATPARKSWIRRIFIGD